MMQNKDKLRALAKSIFGDSYKYTGLDDLSENAENMKSFEEKLRPAVMKRIVVGKPNPWSEPAEDHVAFEMSLPHPTKCIYRTRRKTERLARPCIRENKPFIRLKHIYKDIDYSTPWCTKDPDPPSYRTKVKTPPLRGSKTETGVSRAALKYIATENIKRLAKPRQIIKQIDEKQYFAVKPLSLIYRPSLRILQLAKPRIRVAK